MILFIIPGLKTGAQEVKMVSMNKYITNCLYNFSRNINWPEEKKTGDFIITIVGSKELYTEMTKLTLNMKVGLQPIQVKYFNTVNDLSGSQHIVFVSAWQSSKINVLIQKIYGSSTLVVTENEGMIAKGSMINFIPVNGTMQFEMNRDVLHKNNLMASSVLERMAKISD
jgi:hypothetical protein